MNECMYPAACMVSRYTTSMKCTDKQQDTRTLVIKGGEQSGKNSFCRLEWRRYMCVQHLLTEKNPKSNETTRSSWRRRPPRLPMRSNGSPVVSKVGEVSLRAQALTVETTVADSAASLGIGEGELATHPWAMSVVTWSSRRMGVQSPRS